MGITDYHYIDSGQFQKQRKIVSTPQKAVKQTRPRIPQRSCTVEDEGELIEGPEFEDLYTMMIGCYKRARGYSQSRKCFSLKLLPPIEDELPVNDGFYDRWFSWMTLLPTQTKLASKSMVYKMFK